MIKNIFLICTLFFCLSGKGDSPKLLATYGNGWLEEESGLSILHLAGNDFEMGKQYGFLVGDRVRDTVSGLKEIARTEVDQAQWLPDSVFGWLRQAVGFVMWQTFSGRVKTEIRGMVEGAKERTPKVTLNKYDVAFMNSLIDLAGLFRANWTEPGGGGTPKLTALKVLGLEKLVTNCDSFAAWGSRTKDGKTFQTRNVDIGTGQGLEKFPLVVIAHPKDRIPYLSAAFAGMVGIFTGMNAYGVALGQVWAFSKDVNLTTPWQLEFLEIFQDVKTAAEAVARVKKRGKFIYGNNFVLSDSGEFASKSIERGYVVEGSGKRLSIFHPNDSRELELKFNGESVGLPMTEAVLRGDLQLDLKLRSRQIASNGPNGDPRTTSAYEQRYLGQAKRIKNYEEQNIKIAATEAQTISRETAMRDSSLQAAVYANTDRDFWVSYAKVRDDKTVIQAYDGTYQNVPFYKYLLQLKNRDGKLWIKNWAPIAQDILITLNRGLAELSRYDLTVPAHAEMQLDVPASQLNDHILVLDPMDRRYLSRFLVTQ